MQVSSNRQYIPSFTSITKARVYINNFPSLHRENIKIAVRQLQHILTHPANGDEKIITIKKSFCENVKDFEYFVGPGAKKEWIRNIPDVDLKKFTKEPSDENLLYLFTGKELDEIVENGRKIGPERTKSDAFYNQQYPGINTDKKQNKSRRKGFEEFEADQKYYEKIKKILLKTNKYTNKNGNPLELIINAVKNTEGKITVQNILFKEKMKPTATNKTAPNEINQQSSITEFTKKIKKGAKRIKKAINDGQLSLF